MKIEEAIERLALNLRGEHKDSRIKLEEALKLGIEALKREKERRGYAQTFNWLLLPGETED